MQSIQRKPIPGAVLNMVNYWLMRRNALRKFMPENSNGLGFGYGRVHLPSPPKKNLRFSLD